MRRKTIFALVVVALVALSGTAAALGGWMNETETVGIVSDTGHGLRAQSALAGPVDAHVGGAQVLHLGQGQQITHPGAEVAYRLSTSKGEMNLTLVGREVGAQYDYYSNLEDTDGDEIYQVVRAAPTSNMQEMSRMLVEKHWTSASNAVIANPNYVRDFVGGAEYARTHDYPLLYEVNDGTSELNQTLQDLGVSTVYVTENIAPSVRSALNDTYTLNTLPTDNGAAFVNAQATGTPTLYLVQDIQSVAYVEGAANAMDVMVVKNKTALGTDVKNHLQSNNPDVVVVANENEISASLMDTIKSNTDGSVSRVGSISPSEEMARLALRENGLTANPLVTVSDVTTYKTNGTHVIQVKVRNIGFADAQNVHVEVNRTGGASYTFTQADPSQTDGPIVWNESLLTANETLTIQYSVDGVSGTVPIPHVASYENTAGSSFQGMTILTDVKHLADEFVQRIEGLVAVFAGVGAFFDPIVIAAMVGIAALLGIGVLYFEEIRGGR